MLKPLVLIAALAAALQADGLPKFDSLKQLEEFLFPADEENILKAFESAFLIEKAGTMVTAAVKLGPANAAGVAATVPHTEFRQAYGTLAKYLDYFGPCQKQQAGSAEGWWSSYPEKPSEAYCREVAKLLAGILMWNQAHYCRQLVTREVEPKIPAPTVEGRSWRLDEPPVKTVWLKSDAIYAIADAAITLHLGPALRERAEKMNEKSPVQEACFQTAKEIEATKPSRELVGIEIAKLIARSWEATHLAHFAKIRAKEAKQQ